MALPPPAFAPCTPPACLRWCHFELRTASIVKSWACLWDLSLHEEGTTITFDECWRTLKSSRPPLTSPEQMERELLREKKFTNDADVDVVALLYKQGFIEAFNKFRQYESKGIVYYQNLGWGTAQVPTLVAAIGYAEVHSRPIDAEGKEDARLELNLAESTVMAGAGNEFTDADKVQLRAAVPEGSTKFTVLLS